MSQRLPERLKNITNKTKYLLTSTKGSSSLIWGIFLTLALSFSSMMLFEKQQLHGVSGNVSRDITAVLTSTASSHLYDSYAPIRDGSSGAYQFDGRRFREIKDTSKFRDLFTQLYRDTKLQGNDIVKMQNGRVVFTISDLRLYVSNASGSDIKSTYRAEYTLNIAQDLLWVGDMLELKNQVQNVEYMNKY